MTLPSPSQALLALLYTLTLNGLAQAQPVHRIVGPDGKVTFSDRAPSLDSAGKTPAGAAVADAATGNATLPYELRQIAHRFPVTLYTSDDCAPCVSARNLLINRGVPFTERTIVSNEDIDALKRLSGNTGLPFGTIGGQQLHGFSDSEWTQYLNAAGYPQQSRLPANFRRPAATPLTTAKPAEPAPTPEEAPATRTEPPVRPATSPNSSNPAGIRF